MTKQAYSQHEKCKNSPIKACTLHCQGTLSSPSIEVSCLAIDSEFYSKQAWSAVGEGWGGRGQGGGGSFPILTVVKTSKGSITQPVKNAATFLIADEMN